GPPAWGGGLGRADGGGSAGIWGAGRSGEATSSGPPGADRPLPAGFARAIRLTGGGCDASRRHTRRGVERGQAHRSGGDVTTSPAPPQGQPARGLKPVDSMSDAELL